MDSFEFNKIAGAVLLTGLCAMTVSFVGNAVVPPKKAVKDDATVASTPKAPVKKEPEKPLAVLLAEATVEQGKRQSRKCTQCHTFNKGGANRQGPNLWGVLGRDVASVSGFRYSPGLKDKGGKWTFEAVNEFIDNPKKFARGSKMTYRMRKPDQRAQILVYLRSLSDSPVPLPEAPATKEPEKKNDATDKPDGNEPEKDKPKE